MSDYIEIKEKKDRKTYISGMFFGKYIGTFDEEGSSYHGLIRQYNIEITECTIQIHNPALQIRKHGRGEDPTFAGEPIFAKTLLGNTTVEFNEGQAYGVQLHDVRLKDIRLTNQVHDGDEVFGDIGGFISGYLLDEVITTRYEAVTPNPPPPGSNSDTGDWFQPRYSDYTTISSTPRPGCADTIGSIISMLLLAYFGILVLSLLFSPDFMFFKVLAAIVGIYLLGRLFFSLIAFVFEILASLSGIITPIFALFMLYLIIFEPAFSGQQVGEQKDTPEEIRQVDTTLPDSIIANRRLWQDYRGNEYEGYLRIRMSDYRRAQQTRNSYNPPAEGDPYDNMMLHLYNNTDTSLNLVYGMFDSLRVQHKLDEKAFAEMVVTCVQDIPYVLVLDGPCDASQYNNSFITQYLRDGGSCVGYARFGLFTPTEYTADLKGDCDTKTLLSYTILTHFGYDVVIFGSNEYTHSMLGINLPYKGTAKTVGDSRYFFWETTAPGMKPGVLPRNNSNLKYWKINLSSKNKVQ